MTKQHTAIALLVAPILTGCGPWPVEMTSEVTGKVVDAQSGVPVKGAHVYFSTFPEDVAVSSEDGTFLIPPIRKWQIAFIGSDLRPGYILVTVAKSYRSDRRNWNAGDNREQVIKLESDKEQ